jgi:hypothetical protein
MKKRRCAADMRKPDGPGAEGISVASANPPGLPSPVVAATGGTVPIDLPAALWLAYTANLAIAQASEDDGVIAAAPEPGSEVVAAKGENGCRGAGRAGGPARTTRGTAPSAAGAKPLLCSDGPAAMHRAGRLPGTAAGPRTFFIPAPGTWAPSGG